jgi:hypothetical protein
LFLWPLEEPVFFPVGKLGDSADSQALHTLVGGRKASVIIASSGKEDLLE